MKLGKIIMTILLVVFVGIQFIPTKHNQNNYVSGSDFMLVYKVPKQIESKIKVSCYDCHSNHTNYPWYNRIQPVALIMENHIIEGKAELNFSEWENYSNRRKKSKLKSIISQINDGEMPLVSYTLIHREALLSTLEKKDLTDYLSGIKDRLE